MKDVPARGRRGTIEGRGWDRSGEHGSQEHANEHEDANTKDTKHAKAATDEERGKGLRELIMAAKEEDIALMIANMNASGGVGVGTLDAARKPALSLNEKIQRWMNQVYWV